MSPHRADVTVLRFAPERWDDFLTLHSERNGAGWCRCVAWWVPTWDGWGERSAVDNIALRQDLCAEGHHDGLLAYVEGEPIGWCQLGPRDRLRKLVAQLGLEPDPQVWAVTCFLVAPAERRRGVAAALLAEAIVVAREAGAHRVEGYPRADPESDGDAWTGSEPLFAAAGFELVRRGAPRSVVSIGLV